MPFRAATSDDVPAVVLLVESAYRGDTSRRGWTTEADLLDGQRTDDAEVRDLVTREGSRMILAESSGRLVACCHVERHGESCYFGMFSVDPTLQGSGIGKSLLAEAERIAREDWGCLLMTMTVIDTRQELVAWYERRGYVRTGRHKPFPYGEPRSGIPKRDDLRFEVLERSL